MPNPDKNSSLRDAVRNLLNRLQASALAPAPQAILPAMLLQMLMKNRSPVNRMPAEKPIPRPDLFQPVDPNKEYGQQYAAGDIAELIPESFLDQPGYSFSAIGAAERPEGTRFYEGRGYDPNNEQAKNLSLMDLQRRIMSAPNDTITTDYAKKAMSPELFDRMLKRLKTNPDYMRKLQTL